jgi:hypothetical protein
MRRLLPLRDPLLGRASLVTETHYRPAGQAQVRDDKANSRKQLTDVELHLRHYSSCYLPTGCLVEKALVPDHWFVARPSHGPRQQLRNVPLQAIVGFNLSPLGSQRGKQHSFRSGPSSAKTVDKSAIATGARRKLLVSPKGTTPFSLACCASSSVDKLSHRAS